MSLFDRLSCALPLPVRGALLSVTLPERIALPADQRCGAGALWQQRVLLQSDPAHLDRLMNHLYAALRATTEP